MSSIDLVDLDTELTRLRRKITEWSDSRKQLVTERKDQHEAFLSDQTDKLNSLKGQHAQLQLTAELTSKRLESEAEEMKRTEERLASAKAEVGTSGRNLDVSQALLRKRQDDYRRKVAEMGRENSELKQHLEEFRKQVAIFGERFGLSFRPGGQGDFPVVMTQIDARDHDKEFCVTVRMDGNVYMVTKCEPLIPGLNELISEVNRTNNFAAFVKAVRARFVAIAREEA